MKNLKKRLTILLLALLTGAAASAQQAADSLYIFRFVQGQDAFYVPWQGNGAQLEALVTLLGRYKEEVASGRIPVHVDGYCTGLPSRKENLRMAAVRSNRVKSELILRAGVTEACFTTANHAVAYEGNKDVVTVRLRIAAETAGAAADEDAPSEPARHPRDTRPAETSASSAHSGEASLPSVQNAASATGVSLRTNLLYDAFLLPTLGVEWRINECFGIKLDGSLSRWGGSRGKVQKMWLLNPEARWYLLRDKRFYLGASGSYGEYNIYKYMLGNLLKDDTGYQGSLWNAGLTLGYQLPLCRSLLLDFNLGLGYTRSEYDSFTLIDGVRTFKSRGGSKSFWGPTQAGISLVWVIGGR